MHRSESILMENCWIEKIHYVLCSLRCTSLQLYRYVLDGIKMFIRFIDKLFLSSLFASTEPERHFELWTPPLLSYFRLIQLSLHCCRSSCHTPRERDVEHRQSHILFNFTRLLSLQFFSAYHRRRLPSGNCNILFTHAICITKFGNSQMFTFSKQHRLLIAEKLPNISYVFSA